MINNLPNELLYTILQNVQNTYALYKICKFNFFPSTESNGSFLSPTSEEEGSERSDSEGLIIINNCRINLGIAVKYKDNPPSGWKHKYYIPTILLPGENPNNIKEIKCHSNIIIGYRFNINKERNNDEKGKQDFKNNSTNDYTNNPQDIELLYINMSRDALLRYMDNMDNLHYLISATGIN
nr:4338_t:CDS:2 [Entrophospora candida]